MTDDLTHTEDGEVQMVDIGEKARSRRRAVATGEITVLPDTVDAVRADALEKGDVLATARVGTVQAVKHAWSTIPMCHQIPITNVETEFELEEESIRLSVAVETVGKTGCEMEAIYGVTTGLAIVWDMVKAVEKDPDGQYPTTSINDVRVIEKRKDQIDTE